MAQSKNIGLDIIRIIAAVGVIICHSGNFSLGISFHFLSFTGILAVEVFFVLSGLLVGKNLILSIIDEQPGKALKNFYINRIFRTLPLYYFMLIVTAVVFRTSIPVSCFFFCQNFREADLAFMPVSWSLSVEAWFYFLLPPVFLLLVKLFSRKCSVKTSVFFSIGILCAIPFALRVFCSVNDSQDWDFEIRKQILLRLDSIMMGVFLAAVKIYDADRYRRIAGKNVCFFLSAAGILAIYIWYSTFLVKNDNFNSSALSKIFLFTLLPVLCCFWVMYMENSPWIEKLGSRMGRKWIHGLSTLSYGTYLIQLSVFTIVSKYFADTHFLISWLGFLAAIALTVGISQVTYWLIETPAMKLKHRIQEKQW